MRVVRSRKKGKRRRARTPVVLLQNDAALTTGNSLTQDFDRMEVAKFTARAIIASTRIGTIQRIDQKSLEALSVKFGLV